MTINELIMEIRKNFEEKISAKTGWGKNEIIKQLDLAILEITVKALEPFVKS